MKRLVCLPIFLLSSVLAAQIQEHHVLKEKVVIENDKMKVVEFISYPEGDVCGEGLHEHEPHLTVLLSDVKVKITTDQGESEVIEAPAGMSLWSETERHSAVNIGKQPTKMLLVYIH